MVLSRLQDKFNLVNNFSWRIPSHVEIMLFSACISRKLRSVFTSEQTKNMLAPVDDLIEIVLH